MAMKVKPASSTFFSSAHMSSSEVHLVGSTPAFSATVLVVVDHAVDVHGGRDLQHLAVDGDGLQHRLRERLGGADLVEERADVDWPGPCSSRSRKKLDVGGDEEVRRGAGDEEADQRALAGGLVRHRGGLDRVAVSASKALTMVLSAAISLSFDQVWKSVSSAAPRRARAPPPSASASGSPVSLCIVFSPPCRFLGCVLVACPALIP